MILAGTGMVKETRAEMPKIKPIKKTRNGVYHQQTAIKTISSTRRRVIVALWPGMRNISHVNNIVILWRRGVSSVL